MDRPNVLIIMTDQQRADMIRSLGNDYIYTPNMDRLVARGLHFPKAYSTCPVCMPARATIRTGREPMTTGYYCNGRQTLAPGAPEDHEKRCGKYLARVMTEAGYRTWGVGKFHALAGVDEDLGFERRQRSEELYGSPEAREGDGYASWVAREHPQYDWIDMLQGERTEMYYMPQMGQLPPKLTVERWAADRAVEHLQEDDERPFYGFVSFIGPHPPCAPPQPFNRIYDPERVPKPYRGDRTVDHADEFIPHQNHLIWADDISDSTAQALRARYMGELTYIDQCLGLILDALEARGDADNTIIVFTSDHGDGLGDHDSWQKENFFDQAARIPFLLSWPAKLPQGQTCDDFVTLTDLFAIATYAAGVCDVRDGHDILGSLLDDKPAREHVFGVWGPPGTSMFKCMVRKGDWKLIILPNGDRQLLFHMRDDPQELHNLADERPEVVAELRAVALAESQHPGMAPALQDGVFKTWPVDDLGRRRIAQFSRDRGVAGWPERPEEVVEAWSWNSRSSRS